MLVILVPHHSFDVRCGFSMVLLSGALPSVALKVRTYPGCVRLEILGGLARDHCAKNGGPDGSVAQVGHGTCVW